MSHLQRLCLTLGIIFVSLFCGWCFRRLQEEGYFAGINADKTRYWLQTISIYILLPLSAALSLWGLPRPGPELLFLPCLGLVAYIWGGSLAVFAARLLNLSRKQTGSLFCCGTFTNIGAVGGLVCLLFLGENTIALVALYRLLEEVYYFSIAFPIASWFGKEGQRLSLKAFKLNPALLAVLTALFFGITLNLLHVPRPEFCGPTAAASMVAATVFLLFTIGLTLRLSRLGHEWRAALCLCGIKFIGIPLLITPLAILSDFASIEAGLPLKTVFILCSMPVAMTALIPPSLFGLDIDLANSCWVYSTVGLILWLPFLMLLLPML